MREEGERIERGGNEGRRLNTEYEGKERGWTREEKEEKKREEKRRKSRRRYRKTKTARA